MSINDFFGLARDGLWRNNQALVALLGLCPLLAVTSTVVNAFGLGLATLATLMTTNFLVSLLRGLIIAEVRIPVFVVIIASVVTVVELLMGAHFHELYLVLGIFLPLIVTNCAVIGRAEAFASKRPVLESLFDGFWVGLGFLVVLMLLGAVRELIGYGTLLRGADLLFGPGAADWVLHPFDQYEGFLMAVLPPGAFMGLAVLIAVKNKIDTVGDAWVPIRAASTGPQLAGYAET